MSKQAMKVLASVTHVDDFNAVINRPIDDDVPSARHNEATMA